MADDIATEMTDETIDSLVGLVEAAEVASVTLGIKTSVALRVMLQGMRQMVRLQGAGSHLLFPAVVSGERKH